MGRPRKQTITITVEVNQTVFQRLCIEAYKLNKSTDDFVRQVLELRSEVAVPPLFQPAAPPLAPPAAPPDPVAAPPAPKLRK